MAQLSVRFLGLAALVPPREKDDPWLSVLPNLRNGARAGVNGVPYDIPPHQALVAVRSRQLKLDKGEKLPKLRTTLTAPSLNGMLPPAEELTFFELKAEAVSLQTGLSGLKVYNQTPAGYGTGVANAAEKNSLCWVPPLASISKYSVFDRSLLRADEAGRKVVPATPRLAGTFLLVGGQLRATDVIRAADGKPALYEFRLPAQGENEGKWKQSLATGYELQVTQAEGTFDLVFEDAGGTRRHVTLSGPDVQIWVINRELEEILGFTSLHETTGEESGDVDFAYFYSLAEGWDADPSEIRIPYAGTGGGGGLTKPCGSPQFAR